MILSTMVLDGVHFALQCDVNSKRLENDMDLIGNDFESGHCAHALLGV